MDGERRRVLYDKYRKCDMSVRIKSSYFGVGDARCPYRHDIRDGKTVSTNLLTSYDFGWGSGHNLDE